MGQQPLSDATAWLLFSACPGKKLQSHSVSTCQYANSQILLSESSSFNITLPGDRHGLWGNRCTGFLYPSQILVGT